MIDPVELYENRHYLKENLEVILNNLEKNKEIMRYVPDFLDFINMHIKNINKIIAYSAKNEDLSSRMKKRRTNTYVCVDMIMDLLSGINEYSKKDRKITNAINIFRHKVLDVQTPILIENLEYITNYSLDINNYDTFISSIKKCIEIYNEIDIDILNLDAMKEIGDTKCC